MTLGAVFDALRRQWTLVVVGVLVGVVVATAVTMVMPLRYASVATVYVSGMDGSSGSQSDFYADTLLMQQRATSYAQLITSSRVLGPAGQRVGTALTAGQVAVTSQPSSAVFGIQVTEDEPGRAAAAANAVAQRFTEVVTEVERPRGPAGPPAVSPIQVDQAQPPAKPSSPRLSQNVMLGAIAGLLAALALVVLRGATDGRVRSVEDVDDATGLPGLASIPVSRKAPGSDPVSDPAVVEAVRRLRAQLLNAPAATSVLVVAAAVSGSGTTTVVRALAAAMSHGRKVLVVEANLRRPAIADRCGVPPTPGLTELLTGTAPLTTAVQPCGEYDVLPAGGLPDDPEALLASLRAGSVLADAESRYDIVIVDTPPILPVVDAVTVSRYANQVLLLAREGTTTADELRTATTALDRVGTTIVGTALTFGRSSVPAYGDGPSPGTATSRSRHSTIEAGTTPDPVTAGRHSGENGSTM